MDASLPARSRDERRPSEFNDAGAAAACIEPHGSVWNWYAADGISAAN